MSPRRTIPDGEVGLEHQRLERPRSGGAPRPAAGDPAWIWSSGRRLLGRRRQHRCRTGGASTPSAMRTIAVTAVSDSLAAGELEEAEALARQIGIRHRVIRTEEFADPNYLRNNTDRCYFCKSELYGRLSGMLDELGVDVIASGANIDDMGDHRPGMRAAGENGVRHPAPGMRSQQGRCPRPGPRLGPAHLGQAGDPLPLQPDRLRRGSHPRTRPDDRPGRAVAPRSGACACSGSATTRATWPASRSLSTTCRVSSSPDVRGELIPAFRGSGFQVRHPRPRRLPLRQLQRRDPARKSSAVVRESLNPLFRGAGGSRPVGVSPLPFP